jgi:DNA primase
VRYTENKRVFLSFDADAAGAKAVERGSETLTQIAEGIGIDLRVLKIPGGKDPDECLRSGPEGAAAFQGAIDAALPIIDYQLDRAVANIALDTSSGRIEAAGRVVPILAQIKNAVGRGEYVRNWSMRLRLSEENLLSDISRYRRENRLDAPRYPNTGYQQGGYNRYQQGGYQQGGYSRSPGGQGGYSPNSGQGPGQGQPQGFPPQGGPGAGQGQGGGFQKNQGQFNKGGNGGGSGGNFKKGGKNQKPTIADEEGLPMPFGVQVHNARRAPISGSLDAERSLLALYLTSHEDHQVVASRMADETLLNEFHQRIKEGLDGIGTTFQTMEDLQNNLLGRMGPYPDSAKALIEIILKAEEFRKQKPPVQIVLKESRARILKERISLLKTELRQRLDTTNEESEETALQSRIMELNQLDTKILPQVESLEDIEELKRKIDLVASE